MSGLTNGVSYTFTVVATNSVGDSTPSAPSNSVTPVAGPTAPDPPTGLIPAAGNGQVTVAFSPPASNGGSTITSYKVTASPGGLFASAASSPITVTGLTNGQSYTFTVTATNGIGTSQPSNPSNAVIPGFVVVAPNAPTGVTAAPENGAVTVSFTPPVVNGGAAITSYTVTVQPGGMTASGSSSPILVTGLTNGVAYTFIVTATNSAGTGRASAPPASATPGLAERTEPSAPPTGTPRPVVPDVPPQSNPRVPPPHQ
jgi:predicted RNA-binding protein with TRAM domain